MLSVLANILKQWLFLSVLCYTTNSQPGDEKKMNLRLGFDLMQGENGAHSLRIRDFEDLSEFNPRAEEVIEEKKRDVLIRADSFSDSSETVVTSVRPAARYGSGEGKERDISIAKEEVIEKKKRDVIIRADSFSDSSEMVVTSDRPAARYGSRESKESDISIAKSDNDSNESDRRSTRGLSPESYEPEENLSIHPKYRSSESDSDRPVNRRKRNISLKGLMENLRKKSRWYVVR